jgi:hypothetical protein
MITIRTLIVAATISGFCGYAQAAETVKPLQGVTLHTATKDAAAYYLADKGTCKVVVTLADKVGVASTRFEEAVGAGQSILHQIDDGKALEFGCQPDAQALTINILATVAQH